MHADAGIVAEAVHVDHVVPHRGTETGDWSLFWWAENWQGLCAACHSRKTLWEQRGSVVTPMLSADFVRRLTTVRDAVRQGAVGGSDGDRGVGAGQILGAERPRDRS